MSFLDTSKNFAFILVIASLVIIPLYIQAYVQNSESTIFTQLTLSNNPGLPVQFDKVAYTWTSQVNIVITALDFNFDPNKIDTIGEDFENRITISTRGHSIPYKLVETGPNTGVFAGYVTLTGDPSLKGTAGLDTSGKNPTGITSVCSPVCGPTNGLLAAGGNDAITVSFTYSKGRTVTGTAPIQWSTNEISWDKPSYLPNGQAMLQIVDRDMSLNPRTLNSFETNVWSDSDQGGIKLTMTEIAPGSGIFQGIVYFTSDFQSSGNRLHVTDGDTITGEYVDTTLPPPYSPSDQLRLTATAEIGTTISQLQRVQIDKPRLVNSLGDPLSVVNVDQQIHVSAGLENKQQKNQPFVYLVQIKDQNGLIVSLSWLSGALSSGQSLDVSQSWLAQSSGTYTAEIFVWQDIDNTNPLSPPQSITFVVG